MGLWSPLISHRVSVCLSVSLRHKVSGPDCSATTAVIYPQVVGFQIIILHIKISVGGSTFFRAEVVKRGPGRGHLSAPLRALYQLAPRGPGPPPTRRDPSSFIHVPKEFVHALSRDWPFPEILTSTCAFGPWLKRQRHSFFRFFLSVDSRKPVELTEGGYGPGAKNVPSEISINSDRLSKQFNRNVKNTK